MLWNVDDNSVGAAVTVNDVGKPALPGETPAPSPQPGAPID